MLFIPSHRACVPQVLCAISCLTNLRTGTRLFTCSGAAPDESRVRCGHNNGAISGIQHGTMGGGGLGGHRRGYGTIVGQCREVFEGGPSRCSQGTCGVLTRHAATTQALYHYRRANEIGIFCRSLRAPSRILHRSTSRYLCMYLSLVSQKAGKLFGIFTAQDRFGRPVLLFRNEWKLANVQGELPGLELVPWSRPPDIE